MLDASNIAFFLMYSLTCVAAPLFLRRIGEDLWSTTAVALVAAAATAAAIVWTIVDDWRDGRFVSLVTIAAIAAVAAAWRSSAKRAGRHGLSAITTHDATILSDVYVAP
jgi:uncharacterized protein (DUF2236 family)